MAVQRNNHDTLFRSDTEHIVRKPGKMFKKSQKFNVMDLIENNMGGP